MMVSNRGRHDKSESVLCKMNNASASKSIGAAAANLDSVPQSVVYDNTELTHAVKSDVSSGGAH